MKKTLLYSLLMLITSSFAIVNAQPHRAASWTGYNSDSQSFPLDGVIESSIITSATLNYYGLNKIDDNRTMWQNPNASTTLDIQTAPYLSYTIKTNDAIKFDRFVLTGLAINGDSKLQLRWNVDNFASSLGDFTSNATEYTLTSVNLSDESVVAAGTIEFRVYFYAATGLAWIYNSHTGPYPSFDDTPASYGPYGANVIIWYSSAGGSVLPLTFTKVSAFEKNSSVQINWNVSNEQGIKQYEIERSADGYAFSKAYTVTAKGNGANNLTYNWVDEQPMAGDNFYRIRSINIEGEYNYTSVVKVRIGKVNGSFNISPNPVTGNYFNLHLSNQPAGNYTMRIINTSGQVLYNKIITHNGGSTVQPINLPYKITSGLYKLDIIQGKNRNVQNLIISNR